MAYHHTDAVSFVHSYPIGYVLLVRRTYVYGNDCLSGKPQELNTVLLLIVVMEITNCDPWMDAKERTKPTSIAIGWMEIFFVLVIIFITRGTVEL
jgi:hypothetical protein